MPGAAGVAERTRRGRQSVRRSFGSSRPGRESARSLRVRAVDSSYAAKGRGGEIRVGEIGAGEISVDEIRAAQIGEIGRASCRERGDMSGGAVYSKENHEI